MKIRGKIGSLDVFAIVLASRDNGGHTIVMTITDPENGTCFRVLPPQDPITKDEARAMLKQLLAGLGATYSEEE